MLDLPPPGFVGLDPGKPVTIYHRHLPHWRQEGASYFVTFRLADSLPQRRLDEMKEERERWTRAHPAASRDEEETFHRNVVVKVERWLDQGHGSCVLSQPDPSAVVEDALMHFNGSRYDLFSYAIMPNHVHLAARPREGHVLETLLQSVKRHTAAQINAAAGRKGTLWQQESFDRIIRDTPHLRKVITYIEKNPIKINRECPCWTTPLWNDWMRRDGGGTD